jgi:ATP-binding cassette, subfamily B, bacterial
MASHDSDASDGATSFRARLPVFERLEQSFRRRHIPYVQQNSNADCLAACIAMVLGWHGRHVRLDELRDRLGTGRDGATAMGGVRVARQYGLSGRGVALELKDLDFLPSGSILHWRFDHFVVLDRRDGEQFRIVDPALGPRSVSREEFGRNFTGVALTFEKASDFEPGNGRARGAWSYVRRYLSNSRLLTRIFVLTGVLQIVGVGLPVLTGVVVDRVIPRGDLQLMTLLAVGFAGLVVFHLISTMVRSYLLLHLRTELDARMTMDFLEHLFDLPLPYFQVRTSGDLMMRLNSNIQVREIITSSALSAVLDGILAVTFLGLLLLVNLALGAVVLVLASLRWALFAFTRGRVRELMTENLAKQAVSQGYQVQMFAGLETLKAAGAEPRALQHWSRLFVDVLNVNIARGRLDAVIQGVGGALAVGSPMVVLLVGASQVLAGHMSLGTMLAMSALASGFLTPVATLMTTALQFQQLGSYVDRLDDVLSTPREQERQEIKPAPTFQGRIELQDVTFAYGAGSEPTLHGISLRVEPGQLVAIVGPSGAGKTTLANLMLGLLRPTRGCIRFDGADLNTLEARSVRSQLGVVVQNAHLFGATVRECIALGDPTMSLERVEQAARLAHIHDDVMAMPMGYNTILSDDARTLSGGQRQRIAIARALAQRPAILLLDEATNALDSETERHVHASLAGLGCTRIVIAHRLSTIRDAHLIIELDKGRLAGAGTHEELLQANGVYGRLMRSQTAPPRPVPS